MTLRQDALALLRGWSAPDATQDEVRRTYVTHLLENADGLDRGCYPDHLTASTLIVSGDRSRVLLTLHAKAGEWFQMGGHCEAADATLVAAARREAVEESGIAALVLDPEPVQLDVHEVAFCSPRGPVRHLDVRFVAVAPEAAAHTVSAESRDVRWWPVDAMPSREPGLMRLVALAQDRLAQDRLGQSTSAAVSSPSSS